MSAHEKALQVMNEMAARFAKAGVELVIPPPSVETLGTRYTAIELGKMLEAEFKFDMKFTNPLKMFQGGFLTAAFDDVCGPLTYMAAGKPVVTIEMSTSFIRPFMKKDESILIRGEVVSHSKKLLVLKAEAKSKAGKLIATSTSHSIVVGD